MSAVVEVPLQSSRSVATGRRFCKISGKRDKRRERVVPGSNDTDGDDDDDWNIVVSGTRCGQILWRRASAESGRK